MKGVFEIPVMFLSIMLVFLLFFFGLFKILQWTTSNNVECAMPKIIYLTPAEVRSLEADKIIEEEKSRQARAKLDAPKAEMDLPPSMLP